MAERDLAAVVLARKRWQGKSEAERLEVGKMLAEARAKARRRRKRQGKEESQGQGRKVAKS